MTVEHPYEDLADYIDGTMDAATTARIEAHLQGCAECRADVEAATGKELEVVALEIQ